MLNLREKVVLRQSDDDHRIVAAWCEWVSRGTLCGCLVYVGFLGVHSVAAWCMWVSRGKLCGCLVYVGF